MIIIILQLNRGERYISRTCITIKFLRQQSSRHVVSFDVAHGYVMKKRRVDRLGIFDQIQGRVKREKSLDVRETELREAR